MAAELERQGSFLQFVHFVDLVVTALVIRQEAIGSIVLLLFLLLLVLFRHASDQFRHLHFGRNSMSKSVTRISFTGSQSPTAVARVGTAPGSTTVGWSSW